MIEAWADRRRVLYCPVSKGEFYVLLGCAARDAAARATPIDPAVWARSFPTMRDLFERIRDDADWPQSRWDRFQTIRLKRWSTGRVALLGDAAHAMPPYLAQGAGHAMMNALGLAAALQEAPDIEAALDLMGAPRTAADRAYSALDAHLRRDDVPARSAQEVSIRLETQIPWVAAQYARTANHVPTGCVASDIDAFEAHAWPAWRYCSSTFAARAASP